MIHTDILVVGAGPAGLGAAMEASACGASVLIVDENHSAGGQLYKQIHKFFGSEMHYAGRRGFQIADILLQQATANGANILLDTRALGFMDDGSVSVLRNGTLAAVMARRIILATGARENGLPFPGWTLPGVMTAGAAQTFSNVYGQLVGRKIFIVGSGNVGLIVGYQLMQAGAEIVGLVEAASSVGGYQVHAAKLQRAGVPVHLSHTIVQALGRESVEEVVFARVDKHFSVVPKSEQYVAADTVLLATGLSPRTELAQMLRCQMAFEGTLGGILPLHDESLRTTNPMVYVCGDLAGVEEASTALDEGRLAGLHAAQAIGLGNSAAQQQERMESLRALRSGEHASARRSCKEKLFEKGRAARG